MEELDKAIELKQRRIERLRRMVEELKTAEADLQALLRTKEILSGKSQLQNIDQESSPSKGLSIADAAEEVLKEAGTELHLDELVRRVNERRRDPVEKQALASTLNRYVDRQKKL